MKVIRTDGYSCDGMSFKLEDSLFIGDAVPVSGDIPIFIDENEMRCTLERLRRINDIDYYYPAWDYTYSKAVMQEKIADAIRLVSILKDTVIELDEDKELSILVDKVCEKLKIQMLKTNPLFKRSIACLREGK